MLVLRVSLLPVLFVAAIAPIVIWELVLHRPDIVLDAENWKISAGRHGKALGQAVRRLEQCVTETQSLRTSLLKVEQDQTASTSREAMAEASHALCRKSLDSTKTREEACRDTLRASTVLPQGAQQVCLELPERAKPGGFKIRVSYGGDGELAKMIKLTVKGRRRQACVHPSMLEGAKKIQVCETSTWAPDCFDYSAIETASQ